jgi:hypothetical protein
MQTTQVVSAMLVDLLLFQLNSLLC